MNPTWIARILICFGAVSCLAQEEVSYAPKPLKPPPYTAPHKPRTRLAEVKAKHPDAANWAEVLVDDDHLHAEWISMASGTKVAPRFHPDTREWWIVWEGEVRFEIESQAPFVARKGSMVQAPVQTMYSMEVVGDTPALRLEVNIAHAKTLYAKSSPLPKLPGVEFIPVVLGRKPQPYREPNRLHVNLYDLAKDPNFRGRRFVEDHRALANIIYGRADELPSLDANDRGHWHPESPEFWLVMMGRIRYPIEGQGVIIAEEGDVVYVPMATWHAPRFWGEGYSCRLAMNGYPDISHLRDPKKIQAH